MVILIIPQRQDAPGGIEQGCQKDEGGGNSQREQMRDEGRGEYADHHDAERLALLVQAVEPLVHIHQAKEYGEGNGGDHHTDVVAIGSEIEEMKHEEHDEQDEAVKLAGCGESRHAEIEPAHERVTLPVQPLRQEEE